VSFPAASVSEMTPGVLKKPSTPNLQLPTPKSSGIHWNWGIGSWELTSVLAREKSAGRRRR